MLENIDHDDLVDIRYVSVDSGLPKHERVAEFIRQIKNPYRFRHGRYTVTVKYRENGPTLEDCLQMIMT